MKNIIKQSILALFIQITYSADMIGQKQNSLSNIPDSLNDQASQIPFPSILYYVDLNNDDVYEYIELKEELIPNEKFIRKLFSSIKYPALDKENGIEGNVILEIFVDELGKIKKASIKQSFSKECGEEAKKGFLKASIYGYALLKIDSKPVKYKMDFPIKFRLQ